MPGQIAFDIAKARIQPGSEPVLAHVQKYLEEKPYISTMRVEVHSDNMSNAAANLKLSEARAMTVAKALVARGIDCKRLIAVGFGGDKPIAPSDTAENRAKNRRTSFFNAALRGKAIGGMPVDGGGKVAGDVCK